MSCSHHPAKDPDPGDPKRPDPTGYGPATLVFTNEWKTPNMVSLIKLRRNIVLLVNGTLNNFAIQTYMIN